MSWDKYYEQEVTIPKLLSNLYGQKEFLAEIVERGKDQILEIGTGTGAMSIFLAWLGFSVTSVDINSKIIELAKQVARKLNARVTFEVADAFHLPFPDNSFSLVFHQGLLEHFSDEQIHELIREHLRVASQVILSVPNHWYPRRDFGDERLMTKAQWERILSPFHIVKSTYYSSKQLPRLYLLLRLMWRVPIQYMAVIEKNERY